MSNEQMDLFPNGYDLYGGIPPHRGVDTSIAASLEILKTVKKKALDIYRCVESTTVNGMTCKQVEHTTGYSHETSSGRLREMELKGALIKTPIQRRNPSGCMAHVYMTPESWQKRCTPDVGT